MAERRRDKRIWYVVLGVFIAIFLFTFLTQKFKKTEEDVDAASLAGFDPGYIISDYTMSNYKSMNEAEIQAFLTKKGNCRDTRTYLASQYTSYKYHIKDGHFVCLAEETFGEGTAYGESAPNGASAAHIIWQAAQDYRINPQVLIVLLQKEQGLITDSWPNERQFRAATGYGCPDTAPCSEQYYGFKNQVRKAAAMFRTVLDGGWTNYPLGNNYIQYNPNAACGGSVVNIRSLATSALYRYTPYQPNAGALAAGYGTASCGAYGNRNFYLYFEDWFGGITKNTGSLIGSYKNMVVPRLMYVEQGDRYIEPGTGEVKMRNFSSFEYFTDLSEGSGQLCLSIGADKNCYIYADLDEVSNTEVTLMDTPRMLITKKETMYLDIGKKKYDKKVNKVEKVTFKYKTFVNGNLCLMREKMSPCMLYVNLTELPEPNIYSMVIPRYLYVLPNAKVIDLKTGNETVVSGGEKMYFLRMGYWDGELCLQLGSDGGTKKCILYNQYLIEINILERRAMDRPRELKLVADKTTAINLMDWNKFIIKKKAGEKIYFNKRADLGGKLCLISDEIGPNICVLYSDLEE